MSDSATPAPSRRAALFAAGHVGELTWQIPVELVDAVLTETRTVQRRLRDLPSRVEGDRADARQQPRLVPLLAAGAFAQRPGEEAGDERDAEEDQDGAGDVPHADRQCRCGQPEPAGEHLEVEVAEAGEGDDLEDRS